MLFCGLSQVFARNSHFLGYQPELLFMTAMRLLIGQRRSALRTSHTSFACNNVSPRLSIGRAVFRLAFLSASAARRPTSQSSRGEGMALARQTGVVRRMNEAIRRSQALASITKSLLAKLAANPRATLKRRNGGLRPSRSNFGSDGPTCCETHGRPHGSPTLSTRRD
jgi:hypothetical protein